MTGWLQEPYNVESGGTLFLVLQEAFRLSRAADAASGAGHDLYKVKVLFSAFDQLDQLLCVAQSADHGRVDGLAADLNGEFLDPLQAADAGVTGLLERRLGARCQTAEGCC